MKPALAHREVVPAGSRDRGRLFVLHGFLGAGRNWSSFGRRLVELRPDWRICLIDLRLHGDSRSAAPPHGVAAAARDVIELRDHLDGATPRPAAILGHSFGGKVGLVASSLFEPPPMQTWVIDSTPASGPSSEATDRMMRLLEESPAEFADRDEAVSYVREGGFDAATARWMATNLEARGDGWAWALEPAGLRELLNDFAASDVWHVLEADGELDVHFVRATSDSLLARSDAERIEELAASGAPVTLHTLRGGHWLHVDNPEGLLDLVGRLLPRV